MTLKQKIENHPLVWFLSALLTGFGAGIGAYKTVLEIAHLDVVPENGYVLKANPADRQRILHNLTELVAEGKRLRALTGDELRAGFDVWVQKGMQATKAAGEETHRLFNNHVYFGSLDPRKKHKPADIEKDVKKRIDLGVGILEGALAIY